MPSNNTALCIDTIRYSISAKQILNHSNSQPQKQFVHKLLTKYLNGYALSRNISKSTMLTIEYRYWTPYWCSKVEKYAKNTITYMMIYVFHILHNNACSDKILTDMLDME